jgi:hypothetical protein
MGRAPTSAEVRGIGALRLAVANERLVLFGTAASERSDPPDRSRVIWIAMAPQTSLAALAVRVDLKDITVVRKNSTTVMQRGPGTCTRGEVCSRPVATSTWQHTRFPGAQPPRSTAGSSRAGATPATSRRSAQPIVRSMTLREVAEYLQVNRPDVLRRQ